LEPGSFELLKQGIWAGVITMEGTHAGLKKRNCSLAISTQKVETKVVHP